MWLRTRLRLFRFKIRDRIDSLFERLRVKMAFLRLARMEKNPPTDENDPKLDMVNDPLARAYMSEAERKEFECRLVNLRRHVYSGESGPVNFTSKGFLTEEELEEEREKFRGYQF